METFARAACLVTLAIVGLRLRRLVGSTDFTSPNINIRVGDQLRQRINIKVEHMSK